MRRQRTLTVLVDELLISDGAIPPPRVGSISSLPLRFTETDPSHDRSVTVRARLEPSPGEPYSHHDEPGWSGLLRGDGWTADWSGTQPRTGQVELTGRFDSIYDIGPSPTVRGLVTRIRLVTVQYRASGHTPPRWEPTPGFRTSVGADLDAAPRFFERRTLFDSPVDEAATVDEAVGVLVDLDLDDVHPLPARPRVVPADVSTSGDTVWVVDSHLPKAVRLDGNRTATEYLLPGPIGGHSRRIFATPTGCWVIGADGVYRCTVGEVSRRVDDGAVAAGAVLGEMLLACAADGAWSLRSPDHDSVAVDGIAGSVSSAIDHDGRFVVVVITNNRNAERRAEYRLVRVSTSADVEIGPVNTGGPDDHDEPRLAGDPLHVISGSTITRVNDDLTVGPPTTIPRMHFHGGRAGRHLWTVSHPTDRTGHIGWWTPPGSENGVGSRQYWLLTLLDPVTLHAVRGAPVFTSDPHVTADATGRIWIVADGLRVMRDESMQQTELIDLSALLDHAQPQPDPVGE